MARKKRGNAKAELIQEPGNSVVKSSTRREPGTGQAEDQATHIPSQNTQVLVQHPPSISAPEYPPTAGYFQGSNGVEIHGGRFNQTLGHQTNVTIHVNRLQHEETAPPELPRASTSQLPIPANPLANAYPIQPEVTRVSYTPDNSNKIYERHLGVKQRGFPLWIPEPNMRLPMPYRRRGINIGDVGIITPSGGFSFLFNICRPQDDPINPPTLPEGFTPIYPPLSPMDVREFSEFKPQSYLSSSAIERITNDPPFLGLSFQTSSAEGAILTIPEGAVALDLENIPRFRAYAAANIEKWYRYVNGPRGREAKNGEVRLVIGCDKTTTWAMAAVANMTQHKMHCLKFRSIEDPPNSSSTIPLYRWEYSGLAEARVGPDISEIEELKRDDDSSAASDGRYWNQCIFVRTLNLTLKDEIFEAVSRDVEAALIEQYRQYEPRSDSSPSHGRHADASTQTGPSNIPTGMQRGSFQANVDQMAVAQLRNERVRTSVSASAPKFHPADSLNKALLKKTPNSRVAITEDLDWYSVFTENDKIMPAANEIVTRVFAAHDVKEEDGVAFLVSKEGIRRRRHEIDAGSTPGNPTHSTSLPPSWPGSTAGTVIDLDISQHPPSRTGSSSLTPTPNFAIQFSGERGPSVSTRPGFTELRQESQNSSALRYLPIRPLLVYLSHLTNSSWFWALLALVSLITQITQIEDVSPHLQSVSQSTELIITVLFDAEIASQLFETWPNWHLHRAETWVDLMSAIGSTALLVPGLHHSGMYSLLTLFPLMRLHRLRLLVLKTQRHFKSIYLNSHFQTHITLFLVVSNYAVAILFIRNFIQYDALGPKLSDTSTGVTLILAIGGPLWLIASNVYIFKVFMALYRGSSSSWVMADELVNERLLSFNSSEPGYLQPRRARSLRQRLPSSFATVMPPYIPMSARQNPLGNATDNLSAVLSRGEYLRSDGGIFNLERAEHLSRGFRRNAQYHGQGFIKRLCQLLVKPLVERPFVQTRPSPILEPLFKLVIILAIVCSIIMVGIVTPAYRLQQSGPYLYQWFGQADLAFCILLSAEVVVKILADRLISGQNGYIRNPFNIIDFIIMLSSWLTFTSSVTTFDQTNTFVRSLRALRAIRLITLSETMIRAIKTMLGSSQYLSPTLMAFVYTLPFAIWNLAIFSNRTGEGAQKNEGVYTFFNFMPGVYLLALFISFLGHYGNKTSRLTRDRNKWEEIQVFLNRQKFSAFHTRLLQPPSTFRKYYLDITFKSSSWRAILILSLIMIIVLYTFEQLIGPVMPSNLYFGAFVFIKVAFAAVPLADASFRIIGLGLRGWRGFTFDTIIATGNFASAASYLYRTRNGERVIWEGLFLPGIIFKLLYRKRGFRMFWRTACSCFPAILGFLGLWIINLCFVTLATLQIFAAKIAYSVDTKVSVIGEALAIYTTWGSGKRWVDFTERCAIQNVPGDSAQGCSTPIWSYIILIAWNLINIFISIHVFNTIISDRFSHLSQFFGRVPRTLSMNDIRAFKRAWAELANMQSGLLEKRFLSQFFMRLSGAFEVRIYPREFSVSNILKQCQPNITSDPDSTRVVDGIDLDKLSDLFDTIDQADIRRRKSVYNRIYYEALEKASRGGITFTEMLTLVARHKLLENIQDVMGFSESIAQSRVDAEVRDCVKLDKVQSTLRTIIRRRRFLEFRSDRINRLHDSAEELASSSHAVGRSTPSYISYLAKTLSRESYPMSAPTSLKGKSILKNPPDGTTAETKVIPTYSANPLHYALPSLPA